MDSNSPIRSTMLATLMVFATAAIGLQPIILGAGNGCACGKAISLGVSPSLNEAADCCELLKQVQTPRCCSSPSGIAESCGCNPEAIVCECDDCGCSQDDGPHSTAPAIPSSETTEVVTPTLICSAPLVGYPRQSEMQRTGHLITVAEFAARTSQQTCVLLSRFTC